MISILKNRVTLHILAILIVAFLWNAADKFLPYQNLGELKEGIYKDNLGAGVIADKNISLLNSALSSSRALVIMGSSELTSDSQFIPYRFIPQTLKIPVLAYGHAYFQSLGIYGLLSANVDSLNSSTRLVLLISPGWFNAEMPVSAFAEHFQPQILANISRNEESNKVIYDYIEKHKKELSNATSPQKQFLIKLKYSLYSLKLRLLDLISPISSETDISTPKMANWNFEFNKLKAVDVELGLMKNNKRFVRDDYYDKYLKDIPGEGVAYFKLSPDSIANELLAIEKTLQLLKKRNVRALIVFEPLNPYVYKDASKAKDLAVLVSKLAESSEMDFYDMNAAQEYQPGTLRDGMHVGELGWVFINERILKYLGLI